MTSLKNLGNIRRNEARVAVEAAYAAGQQINRWFGQSIPTQRKNASGKLEGFVTQADLDAERAILSHIHSAFPSHQVLSEESVQAETGLGKHLWVVDPLDGTNNFAFGIPHFSVSIAFYEEQLPIIGVVFNPTNGDVFIAAAGEGAWFNGEPARVNSNRAIPETICGFGFYYDRGQMMRATLDAIGDLFTAQIVGVRRFGSAALDLGSVGIGRFGAFFEYELSPWDFAAGRLFVEEAGGKVTNCQGKSLTLAKTSLLATNGLLHGEILKIVSRHWSR